MDTNEKIQYNSNQNPIFRNLLVFRLNYMKKNAKEYVR